MRIRDPAWEGLSPVAGTFHIPVLSKGQAFVVIIIHALSPVRPYRIHLPTFTGFRIQDHLTARDFRVSPNTANSLGPREKSFLTRVRRGKCKQQ